MIHEYGYLIMERCEEETLFDYINKKWDDKTCTVTIPDQVKRCIFGQIIDACCYLYDALRMVHRDLKSKNVLIVDSNSELPTIKLCDFGYTRTMAEDMRTQCGTDFYCDIRVKKGERYGSEADIYSLGVILYQLYFNMLPYTEQVYDEENEECEIVPIETLLFPEHGYGENEQPPIELMEKMLTKNIHERISWIDLTNDEYVRECFELVRLKFGDDD